MVRRPGGAARLRHFISHGMPAPEVWIFPNGHYTGGHAGRSLSWSGNARLPRTVRIAWQVARVIHRERSMEPVPLTYLIAIGVGVVVGIGLDLWRGWAWWLVAAAVVTTTWLFFLSTAFWPDRSDWMARLRYVTDPAGAHRRELASFITRVAAGDIVAYGLVGWSGPVGLGGWSAASHEITSFSIVYFDSGADQAPTVEVEHHVARRHHSHPLADEIRQDFVVNSVALPPSGRTGDLGRHMAQRRWQALQQPLPAWRETTMSVAGEPTKFALLRRPGAFAAIAQLASGHLVVRGRGCDPDGLAIERIFDLAPYVEATVSREGSRRA